MTNVGDVVLRPVWQMVGLGLGVAVAILISTLSARAEGLPTALSCKFSGGMSSSYEDGKFSSNSPQPLNFSLEKIDLPAQTAQLGSDKSGAGAGVKIVRAVNANHFLEVVNEGFLNLTTVYDEDGSSGNFPAVHSRHFGLLGQPVFAQYTGICRAK